MIRIARTTFSTMSGQAHFGGQHKIWGRANWGEIYELKERKEVFLADLYGYKFLFLQTTRYRGWAKMGGYMRNHAGIASLRRWR